MDLHHRRLPSSPERRVPPGACRKPESCTWTPPWEGPAVFCDAVDSAPGIEPGTVIGDFEVIREIGRGGLAIVLEARQLQGGRRAALKVLSPGFAGNPRAALRFRAEARLAARTIHPGIVTAIGSGSRGGHEYYAEAYHPGSTLARYLDGSAEFCGDGFFHDLALRFAGLARAVDALHRSGVLHRNIQPASIFLDGDRYILGDFKLALFLPGFCGEKDPPERPEKLLELFGHRRKPAYMAPEEFLQGTGLDPRTDIYSLGMTLYEHATGILPFPISCAECMARLKLTRRPIAPRRLNPEIPLGLEAVIRQATERNPLLRHGTAEDLARDLERLAESKRGSARRHHLHGWCAGAGDGAGEEGEDSGDLARIP